MLRRYADQIFNIFNYVDSVVITDEHAVIQYYYSTKIDAMDESAILGMHILDAYPSLTRETSTILRVLETGEPVLNEEQVLEDVGGRGGRAVTTTLPIMEGHRIVGAADISSYHRGGISLSREKKGNAPKLYTSSDLIGVSPSMELLRHRVCRMAQTDSSVLICGETGTGKELIAQSLHSESRRAKGPFISQNCAAIPSTLLEGILFGTEKGSFTGAETRPGLFERANGGTLFLDEINSMELSVQPKILKAIEEKRVTRVGGYRSVEVDVRILSAVNEDPISCVRQNRLREDLFYRLNATMLQVPPLRQRKEDLEVLSGYFIRDFNRRMSKDILGLEKEVEAVFREYSWPGNVRELRNVIENAFHLASSRFIEKKDLPEYMLRSSALSGYGGSSRKRTGTLSQILEEIEEEIIKDTMASSATYMEAAKKLGLSKQAFDYKLKKYHLKD